MDQYTYVTLANAAFGLTVRIDVSSQYSKRIENIIF